MHILHLDDEEKLQRLKNRGRYPTIHSFVVCSGTEYEVFSMPSAEAQLINDTGENVKLQDVVLQLKQMEKSPYEEQYPSMPCLQLEIKQRSNESESEVKSPVTVENFYMDGFIGGELCRNEHFRISATPSTSFREYILQVRYEHRNKLPDKKEKIQYFISAIRIYTYEEEQGLNAELITAALDFGSEASQVKYSNGTVLNIRSALCDLCNPQVYPKKQDYWQGRENDDPGLFKSIYHIHTHPKPTYFGDLPMNNEKETLVQTLLPVTHSDYSQLVLLPNLKLIELLDYKIDSKDVEFGDVKNTNLIAGNIASLGNIDLQNAILRQILSNFMAAIMSRERRDESQLCHKFILLIPNVYYQEKVAKIIDGLYDDFDLLVKNHPNMFGHYRGIEVVTVSESDASYFGMVSSNDRNQMNADKKGAYCLMIDAGKGTTDFSLLHQTGVELSHFESIYRSGIPASGHVLTYAFYEALSDYFSSINRGKTFEKIIRSAYDGTLQTKYLLDFVAKLENQKEHYEEYNQAMDDELIKLAHQLDNWDGLNTFLGKLNSNRVVIPNLKMKIDRKVNQMVELLKTSIFAYAKERNISFQRVYLSGRAFLFEPFRLAVTDYLTNNNLVENKEQIEFDDANAKKACLDGGITDGAYMVNRKSTMLSVPSMQVIVDHTNFARRLFGRLFGCKEAATVKNVMANIDFDFFYKGLPKEDITNVDINICGRVYRETCPSEQDVCLYFVGDGFLFKKGSVGKRIKETAKNYSCNQKLLEQLTRESLFPFDLASMGYKDLSVNEKEALETKLQQEKDNETELLPTSNNTPSPINTPLQTSTEPENEGDKDENLWK